MIGAQMYIAITLMSFMAYMFRGRCVLYLGYDVTEARHQSPFLPYTLDT